MVSVSGKIVFINPSAPSCSYSSSTKWHVPKNWDKSRYCASHHCEVWCIHHSWKLPPLSKHHCHTTFLREPNDSLEFHQVDRIFLAVSFQKLVHQSKKFWNRLESGGADATCPKKSTQNTRILLSSFEEMKDQEKVKTTSKSKFFRLLTPSKAKRDTPWTLPKQNPKKEIKPSWFSRGKTPPSQLFTPIFWPNGPALLPAKFKRKSPSVIPVSPSKEVPW